MKNAVLTGIGGQGTVLAARVLAQAAQSRGWHVRTAETIGMAQRGGSVVSHVRMGDEGEQVASPLVPRGAADILIAFEPGEGARMLGAHILKRGGVVVTATRAIQPVTASLSRDSYGSDAVLAALSARAESVKTVRLDASPLAGRVSACGDGCDAKGAAECGDSPISSLYMVDEKPMLDRLGNAKALNIVLLTVAVHAGVLGITMQELRDSVEACVKPRFREMNLAAVDLVESSLAL